MRFESLVVSAIAIGYVASAQSPSERELARLLSQESARQSAVDSIGAFESDKIHLLLSWTKNPPAGVDEYQLHIGLADVFGRFKTTEAIPFLIKNISLNRWRAVNTWLKAPEVIEKHLPAVAALIQIGPEAARALIRASWGPMVADDRLAAIFRDRSDEGCSRSARLPPFSARSSESGTLLGGGRAETLG